MCEVIPIIKLIKRKVYPIILFCLIGIMIHINNIFDSSVYVFADQLDDVSLTRYNFDMKPLLWTIAIVGGCIGLTLSYVSWKKFKAEEKKKIKKDTSVD